MNAAETRIVERMLDEEKLEAKHATSEDSRIKHVYRRIILVELVDRFERHNHREKNARRERKEKTNGSATPTKPKTKAKPTTGHDLHGHH